MLSAWCADAARGSRTRWRRRCCPRQRCPCSGLKRCERGTVSERFARASIELQAHQLLLLASSATQADRRHANSSASKHRRSACHPTPRQQRRRRQRLESACVLRVAPLAARRCIRLTSSARQRAKPTRALGQVLTPPRAAAPRKTQPRSRVNRKAAREQVQRQRGTSKGRQNTGWEQENQVAFVRPNERTTKEIRSSTVNSCMRVYTSL